MRTRKIGSLEVSVAGLGCNNFGRRVDRAATAEVVGAALDAGIILFDTADIYGDGLSEEYLGAALGSRRDGVVIATKFGGRIGGDPATGGGSAAWVARACEDSLRRLGTERIDLYQLHFPDDAAPIEETLDVLDALVRAGKVREIGNSNFSGEQIVAADEVATAHGAARFVAAQNHYNLLHREPEAGVLPACRARDLMLLPYFPLASGMLTGKYRRDEEPPAGTRLGGAPEDRRRSVMSPEVFDIVEQLEDFARARGRTLLELAIAWLAADPSVASVIAGATRPEQVRANAAAAAWEMSDAEREEVARVTA